jgi:hypothetical protein
MLIIHGGNDYRVDSSQGLSMFLVLQAKHIPSILLYFEAANDWVLKPVDRVLWYHAASAIGLGQGLDPGQRSLARDRCGPRPVFRHHIAATELSAVNPSFRARAVN